LTDTKVKTQTTVNGYFCSLFKINIYYHVHHHHIHYEGQKQQFSYFSLDVSLKLFSDKANYIEMCMTLCLHIPAADVVVVMLDVVFGVPVVTINTMKIFATVVSEMC